MSASALQGDHRPGLRFGDGELEQLRALVRIAGVEEAGHHRRRNLTISAPITAEGLFAPALLRKPAPGRVRKARLNRHPQITVDDPGTKTRLRPERRQGARPANAQNSANCVHQLHRFMSNLLKRTATSLNLSGYLS